MEARVCPEITIPSSQNDRKGPTSTRQDPRAPTVNASTQLIYFCLFQGSLTRLHGQAAPCRGQGWGSIPHPLHDPTSALRAVLDADVEITVLQGVHTRFTRVPAGSESQSEHTVTGAACAASLSRRRSSSHSGHRTTTWGSGGTPREPDLPSGPWWAGRVLEPGHSHLLVEPNSGKDGAAHAKKHGHGLMKTVGAQPHKPSSGDRSGACRHCVRGSSSRPPR